MNRLGFLRGLLAALVGVGGSLRLQPRQSGVPDLPALVPPVTSGYVRIDSIRAVTVTSTTATSGEMTWIDLTPPPYGVTSRAPQTKTA